MPASAGRLLVPEQYPSIGSAVAALGERDTVSIAPGIYSGEGNRNLLIGAIDVALIARDGPGTVEIDCEGSSGPSRQFLAYFGNVGFGLVLRDLTIRNSWHQYGAIRLQGGGSVSIIGCDFRDNRGSTDVGCLWSRGPFDLEIVGCTFENNRGGTHRGAAGAIVSGASTVRVEQCSVRANRGGFILASECELLEVIESTIVDNDFGVWESGTMVGFHFTDMTAIRGSLIASNSDEAVGGLGNCRIEDSTIADNAGGGVALIGDLTVRGSVLGGNCTPEGSGWRDLKLLSGSCEIECSVIDSTGMEIDGELVVGEGVVFAAPSYCEAACGSFLPAGDYRLQVGSPGANGCSTCGDFVGYTDETCGGDSVGACCLGSDCELLSESCCASAGGEFVGSGSACSPFLCDQPVPVERRTWGGVKSRWRGLPPGERLIEE
ncbi:MAG: right-handed parallel beta-helix repeat-containing protein [Candidatus Eisenbacteria bacterium]|nr:right-handed parallel beta-helix repeat-containing protein [Candidatus Eisenbacteria bacterium]MCC7143793.1 right-handed parallel beta-helix repeat-containing protein [Candidatus Eisenbacteria bacterium]